MKKILYLINVPWGWIKQRPHYLAEYLSKYYDVTVYERAYYNNYIKKNKRLVENVKPTGSHFRVKQYLTFSFARIPLIKKTNLESFINHKLIRKNAISEISKNDIVWISSPSLYSQFKQYIPETKIVIYDCMDDYMEFPSVKGNERLRIGMFKEESELAERANMIIFSSDYLRTKVCARYQIQIETYVVNNAIEIPSYHPGNVCKIRDPLSSVSKPIVYIGTVAKWFDFENVIKLLDANHDVHVILIGPAFIDIPKHSRLISLPPIGHDDIFPVMQKSHALIMPFMLNELVLAVNPVKLYEYIYSGKPVISVKYDETEKFADYVYLYSNFDELNNIVREISVNNNGKKPLKECQQYVMHNTWTNRCDEIHSLIENLYLSEKDCKRPKVV